MQKSVRVGDYFDNDDNGVWSWYLTNIRNGDFEEFSNNKLKRTLLKRFLNEHFDPSNNRHHQSNTKILFVSIPDKVHRDLPLLENFLRDYFHLEHLEHIKITKLTKSKVYNHENHYILIDNLNNFEDPSFLRIVNSRWSQQRDMIGKEKEQESHRGNINNKAKSNNINSNISNHSGNNNNNSYNIGNTNLLSAERDLNSTHKQMYGTVSEHPGSSSSNSLSSVQSYSRMLRNTSTGSQTANLRHQKVEVKSILSESVNENFDNKSERFFKDGSGDEDEDNDENEHESIVLNFSHSALQKQLEKKKLLEDQRKQLQRSNNLYSPTHSQTVSISSFQDSLIDAGDDGDEATNYPGQPLALTVTRDEDDLASDSYSSREEGSISELSSVSRSLHSLGSATSLEVDDDDDDDSSDYSVLSILPSISISDPLGHFRLVLQSSLVQNPETKEVYTAIRQSNNEPTVANIEDDWLLYDSNFSMDNLQMLTLQDLLDTNRLFPKIIFYSMIVVSDHENLLDGAHNLSNPNDLLAPSQSTLSKFNIYSDQLSGVDSEASSSNEPKQFYPNSDTENGDDADGYYDDTSLSEKSNPKMYAPTRIQSNATTAHRSIRTVNSIGDWAFLHDGDGPPQSQHNNDNSEQEEQNVHFEKGANVLHLSTTHTASRNGLSKVSTIASMGSVERSKSTPLPIILKSLSIDNEGKRWKAKMDSFRRKRSHKHHNGEKNCTIM